METCTCCYSSQLFVPSLLCVECWSIRRGLLLAKPHGFPTFHHFPSLVGSRANGSLWCGKALKLQKSLDFEPEPEFPPSPCFSKPPPFPIQSISNLRSVSVQTQSSLYSANVATVVIGPSRDTTPSQLPTKASLRLGSADTKHVPMMPLQNVCVCII